MVRLIRLFRTSIGKKLLMALSGLVLVGFLAGHMLGNMKIYQGQDSLNAYAAWLQGHPFVWFIRLVMLVIVLVHVFIGIRLAIENRTARPQRYVRLQSVQVGLASRTLVYSGLLVLAFIIFHLLHLSFGVVDSAHAGLVDPNGRTDVYSSVVLGFQNPWIAGAYVAAILLLGFHLMHAIQSLFHTLGFSHETYQGLIRVLSPVLAAVIVLGFISIPLTILFGFVGVAR